MSGHISERVASVLAADGWREGFAPAGSLSDGAETREAAQGIADRMNASSRT